MNTNYCRDSNWPVGGLMWMPQATSTPMARQAPYRLDKINMVNVHSAKRLNSCKTSGKYAFLPSDESDSDDAAYCLLRTKGQQKAVVSLKHHESGTINLEQPGLKMKCGKGKTIKNLDKNMATESIVDRSSPSAHTFFDEKEHMDFLDLTDLEVLEPAESVSPLKVSRLSNCRKLSTGAQKKGDKTHSSIIIKENVDKGKLITNNMKNLRSIKVPQRKLTPLIENESSNRNKKTVSEQEKLNESMPMLKVKENESSCKSSEIQKGKKRLYDSKENISRPKRTRTKPKEFWIPSKQVAAKTVGLVNHQSTSAVPVRQPLVFKRQSGLRFRNGSSVCWNIKHVVKCGIHKVKPNKQMEGLTQDSYFGGVVLSGTVKATVGSAESDLNPGEMLCVPPHTPWKITNSGSGMANLYFWSVPKTN